MANTELNIIKRYIRFKALFKRFKRLYPLYGVLLLKKIVLKSSMVELSTEHFKYIENYIYNFVIIGSKKYYSK